MIRVGIFINWT